MKEKKGFISTSIIYSFFLVFILLMIAFLMSFVNKRYLIGKINDNLEIETEVYECTKGNSLRECLFKNEYIEYKEDNAGVIDLSKTKELANAKFREDSIKKAIEAKGNPNFNEAATKEEGMFAAEDDYGMSYYYRGAEDDNYVVFADQIWQIIRINGNGSIRMIYKGQYNSDANEDEPKFQGPDHIVFDFSTVINNYNITNYDKKYEFFHYAFSNVSEISFNSAEMMDKLYEKYMGKTCSKQSIFGNVGYQFCLKTKDKAEQEYIENKLNILHMASTKEGAYHYHQIGFMGNDNLGGVLEPYDQRFENAEDSIIKMVLDNFYNHVIYPSGTNNDDYLSKETIFCGDKNVVSVSADTSDYYEYSANKRYNNLKNVTLKCIDSGTTADYAKYAATNLSRYNVDESPCTTYDCYNSSKYGVCAFGSCSGICDSEQKKCKPDDHLGNGELTYPIGVISMDELVYAGATKYWSSNTFLRSENPYWTMTLSFTALSKVFGDTSRGARYFALDSDGKLQELNDYDKTATIRPVINLKSDILYCSGSGTASDPYIIGNGSC